MTKVIATRVFNDQSSLTIRKSALGSIILIGLFVFSLAPLSADWAAYLFIAVGVVLLISLRQRRHPIPSVLLVVVAYIAGYALPVFFFQGALQGLQAATVDSMMQWALRAFTVFAIAYLFASRRARLRPIASTITDKQLQQASFMLFSIGLTSIAAWFLYAFLSGINFVFIEGQNDSTANGTLGQILGLFINLKYSYVLGYILMRQKFCVPKPHRLLLFALLTTMLVDIVAIGSKGAIMRLAAAIVLALLLGAMRRLTVKTILVGLLAAAISLFSFVVITSYRNTMLAATAGGQNVQGMSYRVDVFVKSVQTSLQTGQQSQGERVDSQTVGGRMASGAFGFGSILQFSGGRPPFQDAFESMAAPIYALLPRSVFPDKPVYFNSGEFATEYYGWKFGGISLSLLGSLYWAWGYAGMLIGMLIAGAALAALGTRVEHNGFVAIGSIVCFTFLTLYLLDTGAEFQPILTNLTRLLLFLALLRFLWKTLARHMKLGRAVWGIRHERT